MARFETKIKEGAAPLLEPGEEVLAAFVARPRGWTQATASPGGGAVAGMVGGALGGKKQRENVAAAGEAGGEVARPVGLGGTQRGLLSRADAAASGPGVGGQAQGAG